MRTEPTRRLAVAMLVFTGFGCGTSEPEPEATLDYEVTSWTISGAVNADALAEGAMLSLVLTQGPRVNGMLFMPATITGGADVNADMAGLWTKSGDTIWFSQVAQTFVAEVPWILTPETLTTADSVDGSLYEVELSRVFR